MYGTMATINNEIDFDTAFLIAEEFGIKAIKKETARPRLELMPPALEV